MLLYQKQSPWALLNPLGAIRSVTANWVLLRQLIRRQVEAPYRGSVLGSMWSFLSPLLVFAVYAFVFIVVFKGRYGVVTWETDVDYALGLMLGLTMLQLFQEALVVSPYAILQSPNYVKKVVFPLEILPLSLVGAALIRFLVCLGAVLAAILVFGPPLHATAWWLLPILFSLVLISVGVSWLVAALGMFVRDIGPITQTASLLLMFMSAVFYSIKQIPTAFQFIQLNPMLVIVERSRDVILWGIAPPMEEMALLLGFSVAVFVFGHAVFQGLRSAFSDVL